MSRDYRLLQGPLPEMEHALSFSANCKLPTANSFPLHFPFSIFPHPPSPILLLAAFIVIIGLMLPGCAKYSQDTHLIAPACRHHAIYAALTVGDMMDVPTRIAVGSMKESQDAHAQAQAFIDGKWEWLGFDRNGDVIIGAARDCQFDRIYSYWKTSAFINIVTHYNRNEKNVEECGPDLQKLGPAELLMFED